MPQSGFIRTRASRRYDFRRRLQNGTAMFGDIRPANTIMQVVRFIDPDWLVEIEADAIVNGAVEMGLKLR